MKIFTGILGKYKRDAVFCVLISIFLMASQTWLFKGDELLKKLEFVIRLITPIILIIFYKKYTLPPKAKVLFALYAILIFYVLLTILFSEKPELVALNTAKYLYTFTFPVALFLILRPRNFSYRFLYIIPYLGLFFSIQTIILFILIQTGNSPSSHYITLVGYKNLDVLSYGLWGYAHGMQALGTDLQIYRAQSFFGEPTGLACYLEVATILSFGLYRINKDKKMFLNSVLCAISLIITFSMTAYIVIFLTFFFYYVMINWKKLGYSAPIVFCLAAFLVITIILFYLMIATNNDFYGQSKLGMAFGHSRQELMVRYHFVVDSLRLFIEHPFGIGIIGTEDSPILQSYPNAGGRIAPFVWLGIAGLVGLVIQLTIILFTLKKIVVKQIKTPDRIERYVYVSFVALLLHHCLAGDWFDAMFFYLLVCIVVTDAYQFSYHDDR